MKRRIESQSQRAVPSYTNPRLVSRMLKLYPLLHIGATVSAALAPVVVVTLLSIEYVTEECDVSLQSKRLRSTECETMKDPMGPAKLSRQFRGENHCRQDDETQRKPHDTARTSIKWSVSYNTNCSSLSIDSDESNELKSVFLSTYTICCQYTGFCLVCLLLQQQLCYSRLGLPNLMMYTHVLSAIRPSSRGHVGETIMNYNKNTSTSVQMNTHCVRRTFTRIWNPTLCKILRPTPTERAPMATQNPRDT